MSRKIVAVTIDSRLHVLVVPDHYDAEKIDAEDLLHDGDIRSIEDREVEGGEPGTDGYDTGRVIATVETAPAVPEWATPDMVYVAWDGGMARTWTPIADLRLVE